MIDAVGSNSVDGKNARACVCVCVHLVGTHLCISRGT